MTNKKKVFMTLSPSLLVSFPENTNFIRFLMKQTQNVRTTPNYNFFQKKKFLNKFRRNHSD